MGVQGVNGGPLPSGLSGEQASLLLPAGHRGPAFLVLHNFRAILKYNNSSAYAWPSACSPTASRAAAG